MIYPEMTAIECADFCANDEGVALSHVGYSLLRQKNRHPFPITMDGAASAIPPEFFWQRFVIDGRLVWAGGWRRDRPDLLNTSHRVIVLDTGSNTRDLFNLAVQLRKVAKEMRE